MLLNDWLSYLETLHPKTIDLGLERISRVAQNLGLLPWRLPTITVTGTNGKGSCVAILESVLSAAGYRVGTYTSPHLFHYNERIRIHGVPVPDDNICQAFERIESSRGEISLTYFEFGTLAALLLFQQADLDRVILEVGLGGRLDAVNIIDAEMAIITTIALDHQDWLGTDREAIGREKVAIARSQNPIVCGDEDVPQSVREYAQQIAAPLYCQSVDFGYVRTTKNEWSWWGHSRHLMDLPVPKLALQNMATAFKAIELLNGSGDIVISEAAIKRGLQQVQLAGRFQIINGNTIPDVFQSAARRLRRRAAEHTTTYVSSEASRQQSRRLKDDGYITQVFDVAHNPAAAIHLAEQLANTPCQGRTFAVIAVLLGKDFAGILKALQPQVQEWYVGMFATPRAVESSDLMNALHSFNVQSVYSYTDIIEAYQAAMSAAQPGDRVVVVGSHYTVESILGYYTLRI